MANVVVELARPVFAHGRRIERVTVSRIGPIRLLRFWRSNCLTPPPVCDLPPDVLDALHPSDNARVVAAMTRQSKASIWILAIADCLTGGRILNRKA